MEKKIRLVSYVSGDIRHWIEKDAKKLGMNESTFVRFVLLQFMKKAK